MESEAKRSRLQLLVGAWLQQMRTWQSCAIALQTWQRALQIKRRAWTRSSVARRIPLQLYVPRVDVSPGGWRHRLLRIRLPNDTLIIAHSVNFNSATPANCHNCCRPRGMVEAARQQEREGANDERLAARAVLLATPRGCQSAARRGWRAGLAESFASMPLHLLKAAATPNAYMAVCAAGAGRARQVEGFLNTDCLSFRLLFTNPVLSNCNNDCECGGMEFRAHPGRNPHAHCNSFASAREVRELAVAGMPVCGATISKPKLEPACARLCERTAMLPQGDVD